MNRSEQVAKQVIETVLAGSNLRYQCEQSSGEHDFDLVYGDGTIAAVEVTASVDEPLERTIARVRGKRQEGHFVPALKCYNGWWVHPLRDADIRIIRRDVDEYLSAIEGEGLTEFFAPRAGNSPSVARIFRDLRIECGSIMGWKPPKRIGIAQPSQEGGLVQPEHVQRAVEAETAKPDNKRKLGASGRAERHLFVYIHPRNFLPWVSLIESCVPDRPPSLPPEITDVWVTAEVPSFDGFIVWKAERNSVWQNFGFVKGVASVDLSDKVLLGRQSG